jgi:dissimilatory sulfite reductase (desulfoviridin) alpha/beta subunit
MTQEYDMNEVNDIIDIIEEVVELYNSELDNIRDRLIEYFKTKQNEKDSLKTKTI